MIYRFTGNTEEFIVENSHKYNNYFPLTDKQGRLLSCITPNLAGDIKKDNNSFLTPPATSLDLKHNLLCRREFFLKIKNIASKESKKEKIIRLSDPYPDKLQAGFFYHQLTKKAGNLKIEILNFIPCDSPIEVMRIKVRNNSKKPIAVSACSAIPLYGRSEATLRDHRHVSSLLNRIYTDKDGILLRPTLLFNEEGHSLNQNTYFCLGKSKQGKIKGQYPTLESFCGQNNLANPDALYKNKKPFKTKKTKFDGKEALAALQFKETNLKPGQSTYYILALGIVSGEEKKCRKKINSLFCLVNNSQKIEKKLDATKKYWRQVFSPIQFNYKDKNYQGWLEWVKAQPTLRKLFGCSFLPHFDYGKGGRGWRDLWQDALTLLYYQPKEAKKLILNSFAGVRLDGSNATIIKKDNTFLSDRNKISRVWSDHAIWPYLTLAHYINQTSDLSILTRGAFYFRDHLLMRAQKIDFNFKQKDFKLRTLKNKIYSGTLLEHLLIQHLTAFFNVGKNNIIRLESADWNDALDMAPDQGETVTFTFMYAYNLKSLSCLLKKLKEKQKKVELLKEIILLLDTLGRPINYNSFKQKQKRLNKYFEQIKEIKGQKIKIDIDKVIYDLNKKYLHLQKSLQKKEWLPEGFFNGYYDNQNRKTCGKKQGKIKMMLAPQVFAVMSSIANKNQIKKIWQSTNKYLKDKKGGFRLNTDFGSLYQDLGRAFGFKYGDKENGAFFNHMVVMFAYALFAQRFTKEGSIVFNSIYQMAKSPQNTTYPQLPEYFNSKGQGLYSYLTGSASWYIHTLKTRENTLT